MPVVVPPATTLPPLRATWSGMSTTDTVARLQGANIRWGALRITADNVFVSPSITKPSKIVVSGGFRAERGQDQLIGKSFSFDVGTQELRGTDVSIRHDVFRIETASLLRGPKGISLSDASIVDNVPGENRTLAITASEMSYRASTGQWNIRNLGLSLYKTHILTVPSVRFMTGSTATASRATRFQLPLSIRQSGISGPVATLAYAAQPAPGVGAAVVFEQTAKRGDAASAALSYEVSNQRRGQVSGSTNESEGLPLGDVSSLLAEPRAIKRDVSPRLQLPSVLGTAIGPAGTSAVSLTVADRQEVIRRLKTVLVDNKPMVAVSSSWVFGDSAMEAHFESGNRLESDLITTVASYRSKSSFRVRSTASLSHQRIPFELQTVRINASESYSYTQLSAELLPIRPGNRFSAALAIRDIHGNSTYYSDVLEAPSELQLQFTSPILGWQIALGSRLDLTGNQFFDTEVVIAAPGRVIRPEFRYRTRGNQFAINIAMPFFSL